MQSIWFPQAVGSDDHAPMLASTSPVARSAESITSSSNSDEVIALLELRNKLDHKSFNTNDEILMRIVGQQIGNAITHSRSHDRLCQKYNVLEKFILSSCHLAKNVVDYDVLDFMIAVENECKETLGASDCAIFLKDFSDQYLWCS